MTDRFDVPLEDPVLLEEVELVSSLMVAAGQTDGDLDQSQIDQILGLPGSPEVPRQAPGPGSPEV